MYRKLNRSAENRHGYHVAETITDEEIEEIQREINTSIERHGSVRILIMAGDLEMPQLSALWKDARMTPTYLTKVERFALVGDAAWHKMAVAAGRFAMKGDARHFTPDEVEQAWQWVEE